MLRQSTNESKGSLSKGPHWREFFIHLFFTIVTPFAAWFFVKGVAVNTAQTKYTDQKIEKYITLASMLRDGRNPHGRRHDVDTLPVHRNLEIMTHWWYTIDDYYQSNWLFFDDVTKAKYKNLNQLVFDQMDSLEKNPNADVMYRHNMKQPLVDSCESMINWFREYLNRKYDMESIGKFDF